MPALMSAAIDRKFEQTLAALINSGEPGILQGGRKGVEKESLRVTPEGRIARTPHPAALGSAAAMLIGVALAATYLPTRRATRVEPIQALRCE